MGVFLQFALFPGCQEEATRQAVEGAARNPQFTVDLDQCLYSSSYEGTQVLIAGELGFDALAKELSQLAQNPVMLLYLYDGDFWGYDFYGGTEEDHFSTMPDYFDSISQTEKERLAGNPAALVGWFPTWDQALLSRYLLHWTDHEEELEKEGFACSGDSAPYGDCWQATDFAARLGFPWPFDQAMEEAGIPLPPPLPTLGEILEQGIPPMSQEAAELLERSPLLRLPHALTPEYQLALLADPRVAELRLKEKNPREASESITGYCVSVMLSDRDPLCQRLAAVAAFCDFWLSGIDWAWGWLDKATYEPVYGAYEKPTDAALLRTRAALTNFTKRHRAWKDLNRLMELDPANRTVYQAEIQRWKREEGLWSAHQNQNFSDWARQVEERKRQEKEREERRLQIILEKRRKKSKGV